MGKRIKFSLASILCLFLLIPGICRADESDLFSLVVDPDALLILDLSGSMGSPPPGDAGYSNSKSGEYCNGDKVYGTPTGSYDIYCGNDGYVWADSEDCTGPFYANSSGRVDCSKRNIARKAIKGLLDENRDGKVDKKDEAVLRVRMAYMKFDHCTQSFYPASDSGYTGGCNQLRMGFQDLNQGAQGYFKDLYDMVEYDIQHNANRTPLAGALSEGKSYLDAHKATDPYKNCRKKFVIFLTDGWDTLACGASYSPVQDTQGWSYKRRRTTVTAAKALADAGYKVFVIGFGADMPSSLTNTLNWAAYYGGTDNPDEINRENGVVIDGNPTSLAAVSNPCDEDHGSDSFTLNSSNCNDLQTALGIDCCNMIGAPDARDCSNLAANDPGFKDLSGYAFLATTATQLNIALRNAMETVKSARYSFTVSSVSAARVEEDNYLYEASFIPIEGEPFWIGRLRKYDINDDGSVGARLWDAGELLQTRDPAARSMFTLKSGSTTAFTKSNITKTDLGVDTDTQRDAIVGYMRGESAYNPDNWKLGDTFHSNPITIGSPSPYYIDVRSINASESFINFRNSKKARDRLVLLGANDGQFHAIKGSDGLAAGTEGNEKWSFIPPNLMAKLQYMAHSTDPTTLQHQFFVDGPVTAADVWLGSGDGMSKNADEWKTVAVFGLGRGAREASGDEPAYLWSASPSCDSGFFKRYTPVNPYYCGYFAFNVTDTSATYPTFMWTIHATNETHAKHLNEPWSRMSIGRVKINGLEKWVGFIGGGSNIHQAYDTEDESTKYKRGKGFFAVDMSNGDIIWSYTRQDNNQMDYAIPASPAIVDWDNDGFIDTVYLGDMGGNMWRFRFCDGTTGSSCNTSNWSGGLFFQSTSGIIRPIYTAAAVASDGNHPWVFWGTGDKLDPTNTGVQDRFFALKDDLTTTYNISNLQDITSTPYAGELPGWYINLSAGSGEKMLADPTVYAKIVMFTTYTPSTGGDPCLQGGAGRLYAMAMMPLTVNGVTYDAGAGVLSEPGNKSSTAGGARSIVLGVGMPTAPVVSQKPGGGSVDVFVTVSGGGGEDTVTKSSAQFGESPFKTLLAQGRSSDVIHWKDLRLQ